MRGTGGESVGHRNLLWRGREGDPHERGSPEAAPTGGLTLKEPPGPAPGVTARPGIARWHDGCLQCSGTATSTFTNTTLTLPSPFQGEGLQPLVRVHVAVNVPVPVRRLRRLPSPFVGLVEPSY